MTHLVLCWLIWFTGRLSKWPELLPRSEETNGTIQTFEAVNVAVRLHGEGGPESAPRRGVIQKDHREVQRTCGLPDELKDGEH